MFGPGRILLITFFALVGGTFASATAQNNIPSSFLSNREEDFKIAAVLCEKGSMKDHFRKGMNLFMFMHYQAAVPELMAATMIQTPNTWGYFYAEAFSTLGVIYEFHKKDPDHMELARWYYLKALSIDPNTYSARFFLSSTKPHYEKGY